MVSIRRAVRKILPAASAKREAFMRGEMEPPCKLIVGFVALPKGGELLRGASIKPEIVIYEGVNRAP